MKKRPAAFVFNEARGKSGIRRNTNWMISAVSSWFYCVVSTFLTLFAKPNKNNGRKRAQKSLKKFFSGISCKIKIYFIAEIFGNVGNEKKG